MIHFTAVNRIGKRKILTYATVTNTTLRPRPMIARVSVYSHKEEIMSRRKLLSSQTEGHAEVQAQRIWINHDYPENIRKARHTLAPVLKLAKQKEQTLIWQETNCITKAG